MKREEQFDLMAAKLDTIKTAYLRILNEDLFKSSVVPLEIQAPTWRDRWRHYPRRVRTYCETVWTALCGRDPYEWDDY
jgi:hypothetical protein